MEHLLIYLSFTEHSTEAKETEKEIVFSFFNLDVSFFSFVANFVTSDKIRTRL